MYPPTTSNQMLWFMRNVLQTTIYVYKLSAGSNPFLGVNLRFFNMVFVDKPGLGRIRSLVLLYLGSAHFFTGSGLKFGLFCSGGSNRGWKLGFDGLTNPVFNWIWRLTCQVFKKHFFCVWSYTNINRYIKIRIHFLPISSGSIIHLKKEFFHQDNNDKWNITNWYFH